MAPPEKAPETPPPPTGQPAAAETESKSAVAPAAPAAGADQPKPAPAVVPSAPSITPATISDATRRTLEAAQSQIQAEAERAGVREFGNYAFGRLREAIASGQAEQARGALQEIRNSPQLAKLSSELREQLSTLQGEVEGTLEKPMRKAGEWFGGLPAWARVAITATGAGYIFFSLLKGGKWLGKKTLIEFPKWLWGKISKAVLGTLKWGAIIGGTSAAAIGLWVGGQHVKDNYIDKKNTPPGGTAA